MFKQEYTCYVPEKGVVQRALINPEHLRQVAAIIMYNNNASMVAFKNGEQTIMIALFENDKIRCFYPAERK